MLLFLGRIACAECKDAAYCYRCSVVCVCVCLLDITVSCAETDGPSKMPFGVWTSVGRGNHVLSGGRIPHGKGQLWGEGRPVQTLLLWPGPAGDIDRLLRGAHQQRGVRRKDAGSATLSAYVAAERYDTRCYFNVRSKADMSQLNLPHGNDN